MKLIPIMALGYYLTFIPHQSYLYPVHLDEWMALAGSKALLYESDFLFSGIHELKFGFYVFWGIFQQISGIPWMDIYRYFPGIIFIITILSVYLLAQREGFGWEAAFFTSLIPTTVGILGPAFLVPLTMAIPFIPLALFVAFNFRTTWSYFVLFLFVCFLLLTHGPTGVSFVIIIIPFILLNLRDNFKYSLGMVLAVAISFLVPLVWAFDMVMAVARELLSQQDLPAYVDYPRMIQHYGYLPILLGLWGVLLLAMRGRKQDYGLVLGLLTVLIMLVAMFTFQFGIAIVYDRGLSHMMLMMSIIAGAGLMGIRSFRLPTRFFAWLKASLIKENLGNIFCLALIVVVLAIAIPDRHDTGYYYMIDEQDYQAFTWIRDNINESYEKAILDPWKGIAFNAITEKKVYTAIRSHAKPSDIEAYDFIREGSTSTSFLKEHGITIIYTRIYETTLHKKVDYTSDNPDLVEVAKNIYLLKEAGNDE